MKNMILGIAALAALGLFAAFSLIPREDKSKPVHTDDAFQKFLKQFPKAELPYSISKESLQEQLLAGLQTTGEERKNNLGKPLEDPERFMPRSYMDMMSRVPVFTEPVARLATAEHHAVIIRKSRGFGGGFMEYSIAVFDKAGNHISSHLFAGTGTTSLYCGTIDTRLEAIVETYRIDWEKDYYETGFAENKISGLSLESAEVIDLTRPVKHDFEIEEPAEEGPGETIGAVFNL